MGNLFDNLYNNFLLRDLLGKVLPGLLILLAIVGVHLPKIWCEIFTVTPSNLFYYLILYGASFAVGLVVQFINPVRSASMIIRLLQRQPFNHLTRLNNFLERRVTRNQRENEQTRSLVCQIVINQRERFVVLKDLLGNLGTSLLISVFIIGIQKEILGCLFIIIAIFLILLSWYHSREQNFWEEL